MEQRVQSFVFFNDTATTEIYTLSLHDALPILRAHRAAVDLLQQIRQICSDEIDDLLFERSGRCETHRDRKSTRLNSSHANISYAVFCLKKHNNIHLTRLIFSTHRVSNSSTLNL